MRIPFWVLITFTVIAGMNANVQASGENLAESDHLYANNYVNTWTISEPGASQIRIHFEKIDLKSGDYVKILDKDGNYLVTYGGSSANIYYQYLKEKFWTDWYVGDTLKVEFSTNPTGTSYGFLIDQKETRETLPTPTSTPISIPTPTSTQPKDSDDGLNALSLTKTASPSSIKQGQTSTITLTVKNTGSTEIRDIEIADTIPSYLTFIDGETSKKYDSLAPKDTRQISYTLQFNDAGTFNLEPAIATYADDKGNYNTVKSKTESVEVIRSIIENSAPTPKPINGNVQSASVNLHGEKTDVALGEDVLLKLSAVNIIGNPAMHVQVIIIPPSGWSVTSSEFAKSGAGQYTTTYELESGGGKDIEVRIIPNQIGDEFQVKGRIIYYFGDDVETREDHTLSLPITVRAQADPTPNPQSTETESPGFVFITGLVGFIVAILFINKKMRF